MVKIRLIFISVICLITNIINAQPLFFVDSSSDIIATKDREKTINLFLNSDYEYEIISNQSPILHIDIPFFDNENLELKLERYKIYSDNLVVISTSEKYKEPLDIRPNILSYKIFYKNKVIGILNFFNGEINGTFNIDDRQYEVSKFRGSYVLFESSNSINNSTFSCEIEESSQIQNNQINILPPITPTCLELALEIDNYTRNTFSSNMETTNWALAIMAGVSLIYESEINISIQIVHINIWTTIDPYNSYVNQSSAMLTELRTYWTANNGFILRDLVHMMTKRSNTGTGGIAYRDVLCNNNWGYGFSSDLNNDTTYNFPNPSYTWNLFVCSHEIGHNFSSHHTHWCDWLPEPLLAFPGGIIDNCVDVEGSCSNNPSPVLGTIMSYCHTTSGGAILDFHNVVTTQALIPGRDNAFCLTACDFYGCTDSTAYNYDPTATIDDGSCIPIIYGCIDTLALNFIPTANTDDGSCTYCSILTFNKTDVSCYGNNDGSIDLEVFGGTSPFTYNWTSSVGFSSNTQDLFNLPPALYTVVVMDLNGCSEAGSVTINEPSLINISGSNITDVSCNGFSDGFASLIISGGTFPYSEDWGIYNPNSLASGSYLVFVTDSNNCPMDSINIIINQPLSITVIDNVNDITCNSYNDGSINITTLGGTLPYNYNWSSTNGYFSINEDINNLQSGTYTVVVTDSNSCTDTFSYNILEPPQLILNSIVTDVSCYGAMDGSIDLTISGGVPPYNFVWSNGSTSEDLTNIPSSNYWVNLIDDNQCAISTQYFTVSQPNASVVSSIQTNVSCNGFSDGQIDITFTSSSSTSNVTYLWTGPNNFSSINQDINNLITGLYTLTIIELPCTTTEIYYISEPDVLGVSESIQNVNCFGHSDGQASLTISGGTPPFTQNWFGANSNALSSGIYYYEIIDSNNCLLADSVAITQPNSPISVVTTVTSVTCNGGNNGTAQVSVSGGTQPYNIIWQNSNPNQLSSGYNVFLIIDNNQCIYEDSVLIFEPPAITVLETITNVSCNGGTDGEVNLIITGGTQPYNIDWGSYNNMSLSAGSYIYQVSDINSCVYSSIVSVAEPLPISVIPTIVNASCPNVNNGSVQINISGGTPPYFEDWQSINPAQIAPGIYTYFLSDSNQCVDTHQVIIGSVSNISVQELKNDISCFGFCDGNVSLYISGGVPPYLTDWFSYSPDSLCEGLYSYEITDSLQCIYTDTISIIEPQLINLSISQQMNQLSAAVTGGTPPYSYYWWNSSGQLGTFSSAFVFSAGTYYCIVFDTNQCHSDTVSYFVTEVDITENLYDFINIFPNPFSESFNILFPDDKKRDIFLIDALGRIVYENSFSGKRIFLDTENLSSAIYLLKVKTSKQVFYRRIVKR